MTINWYPGHMVKARREIEENIKLVDIVTLLLDARAPFSCRNPELEKLANKKKVIFVLNKMDLASPTATEKYLNDFSRQGYMAVAMDSLSGKGSREVIQAIKEAFKDQEAEMRRRGRRIREARVMVAGVPNIGKSTFLNSLVGKKIAMTGAKPGITRGKQWVRVRKDIEFMDTPGLMWPKVESTEQGLKLALLDIVGERAYQEYDVALFLIDYLVNRAPQILQDVFGLTDLEKSSHELLGDIARRRGHLVKGGALDTDKTCLVLLQEFRKGKLGRLSLD
ncbi:MAG: ribosome biogenesis GTPase YlqF [Syntrophomonadaceae bacterium]|jgi:ribosome biogenesis GTPase A